MFRKLVFILLTALLALQVSSDFANAQVQITTKKDRLSDFTAKTTKVVLSGNDMADEFLKDAMLQSWRLSAYEFCSKDEFESLKTKDSYYFLLAVAGQNKKESEPGVTFLTLVKGGSDAKDGLDAMYEVISIPYCSTKFPSGREAIYAPALLDIIQDYTQKAINNEIQGFTGLSSYNTNLSKMKNKEIIFSEDDLSANVTDGVIEKEFKKGMKVLDEDDTDEIFIRGDEQAVVSFTVYPSEVSAGSMCYKMLIDVANHDLYYFKKHKISAKAGPGFLPDDIKKVASSHKSK